jgi:serine/threonine-protein kinase
VASSRSESQSSLGPSQPEKRILRIGVYEVLSEIGEGASATVYLGRTPRGDLVAIKVLHREDSSYREARERFAREAMIASRIDHPGIVRAVDSGEDHGLPYLVMEYVAGMSLAARLQGGTLAVPEAARILAQVARAMHAAHGAGTVHRDLKPANILLDREGNPRVSDFGLARDHYSNRHLTQQGEMLGTPYYMAPEQIRGETATPAADVWALGVLLFESVTGKRPFEGRSVPQVGRAIMNDAPLAPSRVARQPVPSAIDALCNAMLSKDPKRRPSMEALGRDLEAIASAGGSSQLVRPTRRARPVAVAVAAFAGLAVGAGIGAPLGARGKVDREKLATTARELESVAANASSLRASLDKANRELERATRDKAAHPREEPKLGHDHDRGDLAQALEEARNAEPRVLAKIVDRTIHDLENGQPGRRRTPSIHARLLLHRGRAADVLAFAQRFQDGSDVELARIVADALAVLGDQQNASDAFKALAEHDPEGARGIYARGRLIQVRSLEDAKQAIALFEKAASLDPSFGDALAEETMVLAQILMQDPSTFDAALAVANRAVEADPTAPHAYYARSYVTWDVVCARAGRGEAVPQELTDATCSDLRSAYALEGKELYRAYCGKTLVVSGRAREGLPDLEAVVAATPRGDPSGTLARTWRGNAKLVLGDEQGAVDDWLAALAAGPRECAMEARSYATKLKDEDAKRTLSNAGMEGLLGR